MALPVSKHPLDAALAHLERATCSGEVAAAVLHVEARGQRHVHAFGKARPDTIFLLASITKPMSAVAIMTLVEEGRLGLDDPASRVLDGATPASHSTATATSMSRVRGLAHRRRVSGSSRNQRAPPA
jgi:CubicO group peptidase (beta-lactamase class C family)